MSSTRGLIFGCLGLTLFEAIISSSSTINNATGLFGTIVSGVQKWMDPWSPLLAPRVAKSGGQNHTAGPQAENGGPGAGLSATPSGFGSLTANNPGAIAAQAALSQLGVPYVYAAEQPGIAFDCSGLTQWAYSKAGITLPRHSTDQAIGQQVTQDQLEPGDLSVWDGHVNIYVGNGQIVEAPEPGETVHERPVYTDNMGERFLGFFRPSANASTVSV